MKVLIVEDEVVASRGLIKLLQIVDPSIEVVATLRSVKESVEWLHNHDHPPLIFMDIQLRDGDSFKIFQKIEVKSEVIFCTAYEQYAIEAFKVNSLHYLLKPIDQEGLKESLTRFHQTQSAQESHSFKELLSSLNAGNRLFKKRFLVKAGQKYSYVSSSDIAFFYTEEKLNFLVTQDGRKHIIDEYLDEIQNLVDPTMFFRINRQYIINIDALEIAEKDYGKYDVLLKTGERISISKSRIQAFKDWLDQ